MNITRSIGPLYIFYVLFVLSAAISCFRKGYWGLRIKDENRDKYDIEALSKFKGAAYLIGAVWFAVLAFLSFSAPRWFDYWHWVLLSLFLIVSVIAEIYAERRFRIAPLTEKEQKKRRILKWVYPIGCVLFTAFVFVFLRLL